MTTEPPTPPEPTPAEPPAVAPPAAPPSAPSPLSTMTGETFVTIGAALVLGSYLVFGLIANEFHQYTMQLVAGAFALIVPFMSREAVEKVASYPVVMKVLGYIIAVSGVFEILFDVRFGYLDEFMALLGALIAYAGYVLAFIGARTIKT